MKLRKFFIRTALILVYIGLGAVLFVVYRGHTLLVDNHNVEQPAIRAPDLITITLDKGKSSEFFRNDRDRFSVRGSNHHIRVEFSDGKQPFEGTFVLPLKGDMYILSIPKMLGGIEPFVEVFHTVPEHRAEEEVIPVDEFFAEALLAE
jgi:hypothetical protein